MLSICFQQILTFKFIIYHFISFKPKSFKLMTTENKYPDITAWLADYSVSFHISYYIK